MILAPGTETNAQYHANPAWGSTLINDFIASPTIAHLKRTGQIPPEESSALTLGQAFHARFDPHTTAPLIGPDVSSRRTKAWGEFQAAHPDAVCLLPDEVRQIDAMEAAVRANPYARDLLDGAEHEVVVRRESPYGAYGVQCRIDLWRPGLFAADLKTTSDLDGWGRSVAAYGYHRQAAFYRWLIAQETAEILPFSFIVVEKDAPHRCRVIELDDAYLAAGWREVETALIDIGQRTLTGDWSDPGFQVLTAPGWLRQAA